MLTDFLRHLPTPIRLDRRRRIEALADRWAARLRRKYGDGAAVVARRHLVASARRGDHFRNHLWLRIYRELRG